MNQLTKEDQQLVASLQAGSHITTPESASNTYRALQTNILFQLADSQMAGTPAMYDVLEYEAPHER